MAIFEPNIYMREIKELYSEELALLKQIRSYGREHSQGKMERVEKVKLLLLFRIYSNLYSSLLLTVQVLKTGKISFFSVTDRLVVALLLYRLFVRPIHTAGWQGTSLRGTGSENNRVCQLNVGAQRGIQRSGEKYGKDT